MSRLSRLLIVGVCLAMLMGPAAAAPATVAIDAPSTVASGDEVTLSLTLTNTGDSEDFYLVNVSAPEGWSVVDNSDDGGEFDSDDVDWLYLSVDADESVQPSVTFATAGDGGTAEITATAENSSGLRDVATHSITVESDSDAGGGGGSGDDGSSSSGDDGGSSSGNDGGSSSGDDGGSAVDVTDTSSGTDAENSDDSYSGGDEDAAGDGYSSDGDGSAYTASGSDTDDTGSSSASYDGGGSTEITAEPSDGSNSVSEDDGDQSVASGLPIEGGLGIGAGLLGTLLLFAIGVGVITVRRDSSSEPASGGGSTPDDDPDAPAGATTAGAPEVSAFGDELADAGIDVVDLRGGQTATTLTYATAAANDSAARVEIRTIVRAYVSAADESLNRTRLEATVHGENGTLGAWHIHSEWLSQLADGNLSMAALDERVFETIDRTG